MPLLKGSTADSRKEIMTEHLWELPEIPQTEAVRTDKWKYIRYPQHPDFMELYDLQSDPIERNNLALDNRYSEILTNLGRLCDRLILKAS